MQTAVGRFGKAGNHDMKEMTTAERMQRLYAHKEPDRAPIIDSPWDSTVERWQQQGLPDNVDYADFLGMDLTASIRADNSPRYPVRVLEETDEFRVITSQWGSTQKLWSHAGGVPEFIDFIIKDRDSWNEAKQRMTPTPDRIDWDNLKHNYRSWRKNGAWITASFWFGFDVTHSWMVGTERVLMAMITDPEWVSDMFNHMLEMDLALFQQVWDEGYEFDEIHWPDDMGYKLSQFFSVNMYRDLVKPVHKKAADWAHEKGVKVKLHSCGDIRPFVPDLVDLGIDMLNPLEVKAGVDPIALKREYGDRLAFHGGLNAVLYDDIDVMIAEMERVVPLMKENGGYIIGSDHSVPDSVSLSDFQRFMEAAKRLGSYE